MLEERRLDVLRAIVEGFVLTNEPVGSRAVAERGSWGSRRRRCATTWQRSRKRATSSSRTRAPGGCPPTRATGSSSTGSRRVKPMSVAERRAIETFLEGAIDLDDVVRRSVRLLAQLTRQVAVVQYPTLSRAEVRHVEVVAMTSDPAAAGADHRPRARRAARRRSVRIRWRTRTSPICAASWVRRCTAAASSTCRRRSPSCPTPAARSCADTLSGLVAVVLESLVERPEERVLLAGTANLTRSTLDFPHTLRPVLEALEEQVVLLRLLGSGSEPDTVTVRIGARERRRGPADHLGGVRGLRLRWRRRARPDPDGLSGQHGGGAGGRPLRRRAAGP